MTKLYEIAYALVDNHDSRKGFYDMRKDIVIFDLDGTLALIEHRRHLVERKEKDWDGFYKACVYDEPNKAVIAAFHSFKEAGHFMVILSGRSKIVETETHNWLMKHNLDFDAICMRADGDYTPDEILKKQWLEALGKEHVLCVFDDRDKVVKMWRDEGLTCFQVAAGDF